MTMQIKMRAVGPPHYVLTQLILGTSMALYQIRLLGADGSIESEDAIEFPDDDAAIEHAGDHAHPHIIEIWEDERLVGRAPPLRPGL